LKADNTKGTFWSSIMGRSAFAVGLIGGLAVGWLLLPQILYSQQHQPLDFNHVMHTEDAGMDCTDCHGYRDDGSFAGIPTVSACEECHAEPMGESTIEQQMIDDYITPGQEIPWLVYSRQPQNVYFSHAAHVELAGIECSRCHGDHGTTTTLPVHEVNRISTYSRRIWGPRLIGGGPELSDSMKMSDCSDCHAERGIQDHCLMCHK